MNVIVIITDSLRVDHVGCYGSAVKTPNLDKLAQAGCIFLQAFSESLPTMPTRASWWTGRVSFPFRGWQQFEHSDLLLAEILWDKGYTSALISDTYHMHKPVYNCGRGFDYVVWIRGQEYDPYIIDTSIPVDLTRWHRLRGDETDALWRKHFEQYLRNIYDRKTEEDYFIAKVIKEAIRWLEYISSRQKDRIFLWVDCFDPHEPWDPPEPYWSMYDPDYKGQELIDPVPGKTEGYMTDEEVNHTKSLYAGEVTFVDRWVGILLEELKNLGIYDNSLIIHTSDHGEPFGEHGIIRKAAPWNYEELVHIPWIIRHPEGIGSGKCIDAIVQTTDLLPTILDALGINREGLELPFLAPDKRMFPQDVKIASKEVNLHGFSLLPLMRGEIEKIREFACIGHYGQQWSIRNKEYSYHLSIDKHKPPELYNLKEDPKEQNNIIETSGDVAEYLELQLYRFVANLK